MFILALIADDVSLTPRDDVLIDIDDKEPLLPTQVRRKPSLCVLWVQGDVQGGLWLQGMECLVRSRGAAVVQAPCRSPWTQQTQEYGDAFLPMHTQPPWCRAPECLPVSLFIFAFANLFGSLRSVLFPACPAAISSSTRVCSAAAKLRISGMVFLQWDPWGGVAWGCRGFSSPQEMPGALGLL